MKKLTVWQKLSFGVGAIGKDLVYLVVANFILVYFTDVYHIDPVVVGLIFLIARFFDAINDPVMGLIVDNTYSRFGKFKPYLVIGTIINAIILILLYFKPDLSRQGLVTYAAIMYILWGLTYTIMDIPYWSMIPDLGDTQKERNQIASIPRFFAGLANLLMGGLGLVAINYFSKYGDNKNDFTGYFSLSIIVAIIFLLTIAIVVIFVPTTSNIKPKSNQEKISVKRMFKVLFFNEQVMAILIISVLFNLMLQFNNTVSIYVFRDIVKKEYFYSNYLFICALGQMGGVFLYPFISNFLSRSKIIVLGAFISLIASILIFVLNSKMNIISVNIIGILFGLNLGFMLPILTVLLANGVDYGEKKFGLRTESIIFSTQTFVVKLASALSGFFIGIGLKIAQYTPHVELTDYGKNILISMMALLPIFMSGIYIFVYFRFYKKYE